MTLTATFELNTNLRCNYIFFESW